MNAAALVAPGHHATGHSVGAIGFLARLDRRRSRSGNHALKLVREGVDPLLAQAVELGPAVVSSDTCGGSSTRGKLLLSCVALDLRDLQLAGRTTGTCTLHGLAALVADQGATDRRLGRACSRGSASAEPTILNFVDLSVFWVLHVGTVTPTLHDVGVDGLGVDHPGVAASPRGRRSASRASPARSWRRRTRRSRRCPQTRASLMRSATSRRLSPLRCGRSWPSAP